MPHYKIIDYSHPTSGELARLMLLYADKEYEDVQVKDLQDILEAEKDAPLGILPVLVVDGKVVAQNQGICRYLARNHGLIGKTNRDAAVCDMVMDGLGIMFSKIGSQNFAKLIPEEQKMMMEITFKRDVPIHLGMFEKLLKKNGPESQYFAGNELTWCDLGVCLVFGTIKHRIPTILDEYPLLQSLVDKVSKIPAVQDFLKSRLGTKALVEESIL